MESEDKTPVARASKRQRPKLQRPTQTYVVCVSYPNEWPKLRGMVEREAEGLEEGHYMQPVQNLPMQRLDEASEVRCAFFLDAHPNGEREPYITEPVKASKHWEPGRDGWGGKVRNSSFLEELGKLCLPSGGARGGVSIHCRDDILRVGYGG